MSYTIVISPLSEDDGGGFLARVPDLPGCMSDGATELEAVKNVRAAQKEWISEYIRLGRDVPPPGDYARQRQEIDGKIMDLLQNQQILGAEIDELRSDIDRVSEALQSREDWDRSFKVLPVDEGNDLSSDPFRH
ncbi:MAG: type II toxin-antitoxin system HicB family antitoxin [Pseudomonadota bacterium]